MSHYFHATLQLHNSPVYCARELFKPLKDATNLQVCNEKNISWFWVSGCLWVTP